MIACHRLRLVATLLAMTVEEAQRAAEATTVQQAQIRSLQGEAQLSYRNCTEAHAAAVRPIYQGQPVATPIETLMAALFHLYMRASLATAGNSTVTVMGLHARNNSVRAW